jgi:two-component system response regulator (stage 0 sporulation protein F)
MASVLEGLHRWCLWTFQRQRRGNTELPSLVARHLLLTISKHPTGCGASSMSLGQSASQRNRSSDIVKAVAQKQKRILLVDSDEVFCRTLTELLEGDGYSVTICGNTVAAFGVVETDCFDFVISTHSSSDVNGLQVLERVKRRNSNIPVLLIAPLHEMESYIKAIYLGALDYICKPVDYSEIQWLLDAHEW